MTIDTRAKAAAAAAIERTHELPVPSVAAIVQRFTRRRRRRTLTSVVLALAVGIELVVPVALFSDGSTTRRISVDTGPVTSPPGSIATRFIPSTRVQGNTAIVAITTPDGTRLELRYPKSLAIAESGYATGASVEYCASSLPCAGVTIPSSYMLSYTTLAAVYGAAPPLATYRDLTGQLAGYYQAPDPGGRPSSVAGTPDTTLNAIAIQIGPWLLQIPDRPVSTPPPAAPTPAVLAAVNALRAMTVASIGAHLDGDGYLVLHLKPPLSFTPFRELKGLAVFGGTDTTPNQLSVSGQQFCTGPGTDTTHPRRFTSPGAEAAAAWCDPQSHLHLSIKGTRRFVTTATRNIALHILRPPKPTRPPSPTPAGTSQPVLVRVGDGYALTATRAANTKICITLRLGTTSGATCGRALGRTAPVGTLFWLRVVASPGQEGLAGAAAPGVAFVQVKANGRVNARLATSTNKALPDVRFFAGIVPTTTGTLPRPGTQPGSTTELVTLDARGHTLKTYPM